MIFHPESAEQVSESIPIIDNTVDLWKLLAVQFPTYIEEIAISILPIVVFFGIFQLVRQPLSYTTCMLFPSVCFAFFFVLTKISEKLSTLLNCSFLFVIMAIDKVAIGKVSAKPLRFLE